MPFVRVLFLQCDYTEKEATKLEDFLGWPCRVFVSPCWQVHSTTPPEESCFTTHSRPTAEM